MTPIAQERIIRASLQAILAGEGSVETRLNSVVALLSGLSAQDKRLISRKLKIRLARALRQKSATVTAASALSPGIVSQLKALAEGKGLFLFEERENPKLLAGFQLQLGDDRTDFSLHARLQQL